jgi:hypothetical protein
MIDAGHGRQDISAARLALGDQVSGTSAVTNQSP